MTDRTMLQLNLLQEAVSCAAATLFAIEASDLLRALPADEQAREQHNHGCVMLAMLGDHLRGIQARVDAMDAAAGTKAEGR